MPSSRPRDQVTETVSADEKQREAISRTSGALTGDFDEGYLDELREDWPE